MSKLFTVITKGFLSFFGVGLIPLPPILRNLLGSLSALIPIYFLRLVIFDEAASVKIAILLMIFAVIFFVSVILIQTVKKEVYDQDWIVIDEALGVLLASAPVFFKSGETLEIMLTTFVLFQFFSLGQPFGIKSLKQKNSPHSVLIDDILAGLYALILILFLGSSIQDLQIQYTFF